MLKRYRTQLLYTTAGVCLGYLVLHPYSMLVSALLHLDQGRAFHLRWQDLSADALALPQPMMLPMAGAFAVLGGVIGLLTGTLVARTRRLYATEAMHERRRIALDITRSLVVTLSHYLLNANMIIGGKVRRCQRLTSDQDIRSSLAVIEEQGRKIDAVISALRKATEVKLADYTADGTISMVDITRELEQELAGAVNENNNR